MLIECENYVPLELPFEAWFSLGFESKPPHFPCLEVFGSQTTQASRRVAEREQEPPLEVIRKRCLPTLASPACFRLCRYKRATKWGETLVHPFCSCFITLLISILIFAGFLFRSTRLEVQFVHTLVFGEGVYEPALTAPPCHCPHGTMQKSGSGPRRQGEKRGSKVNLLLTGQITEAANKYLGITRLPLWCFHRQFPTGPHVRI